MTTVTENDLKKIGDKIDKLAETLTQILINQTKSDTEIKELSKRVDDIINRVNDTNNRLNTITIGVLVAGLLGIIGRVVFFPNV
jgi:uncharacterized protein Yka (UPF0111/DUF47 family)